MSTSRTAKGEKAKPAKKPTKTPTKKLRPSEAQRAKKVVAKAVSAKPSFSLHFTNRRFVPGMDFDDPVACKGPWLDESLVAGGTRKQLVMLVGDSIGGERSEAELFSGGYDTFKGFCEVPVEWWDVVDDDGKVRYQLWLFGSDSGALFVHNTTKVVGYIIQCGFESDGIDQETEAALAHAYHQCRAEYPKTELGRGWVNLGSETE